jgi:membrane protein DedA with SNARE-associated domain
VRGAAPGSRFNSPIVAHFSYLALFVGAFLEGEGVVFLAGIAAQHGYLWLPAVLGVAMSGAFLADQTLFFVGRRYGDRVLARFPVVARRAPRVQAMVRRWDVAAIILMRFLWGLRTAAPIIIGSSGIAPWRLVLFDLIGVLLWGTAVAGAGYFAGGVLQQWAGRMNAAAVLCLMAVLLILGTAWNLVRAGRR